MRIPLRGLTCRNIVLFLMVLWLSAGMAAAQEGRVVFSGVHITAGKAMAEIQAQSGYKFAFNPAQLDTGMPVRFSRPDLSIREALAQLFDGRFAWSVHSRFIAVKPDAGTPERANAAAHAQALTSDVYRPTDLSAQDGAFSGRRDSLRYGDDSYVTERIVTVVPAAEVVRDYPTSHSDYHSAGYYSKLYTRSPRQALKTNLLYAAGWQTPNLFVELVSGARHTVELGGSYRWWGRRNEASDNHKQLTHWMLRGEYRRWTCQRFSGHYFGAHALYSRYFVSGQRIPLLFSKQYSYDGQAVGVGIAYGYHWALARRWSLELNLGVGYAYLWGKRGTCRNCDWQMQSKSKHYVGPTRAGIQLVYLLR